MSYSEVEAKFLGPGETLTREPCYKKLKSTADISVFPHHGGPDIHRIQEKTGNNRVPMTIIDVRGCSSQEDSKRTAEFLKPTHDEMPGNRRYVIEAVDSKVVQDGNTSLISRDDEIYSTSKAFIGPLYKPPGGKKSNKRKNETDTLNNTNGKGRREEKQKFNSKKTEIDTELSQFYKEIEELENEKDASQDSCKEPEPSQEQIILQYQGYNDDLLNSDAGSKGFQSHCGYQQYFENEPGTYPCGEPPIPTFCDFPFPSFRPEWQSVHPFIIPHVPPPSFNYHLNIQRFSAPPHPPPNIFHSQDDSRMQNGCCVNSYPDNRNCLTFDHSNEYTNYTENSSSVHPSRNGYSVQDGYVSNGFCEIKEGYWKDPFLDKHNGTTDGFVNQQFQEEKLNKLQKLLILLRGLPGSGKTTLSRILLGQSRDGIVFSTDDYFHHQDGYKYNVNQLGDAHDWNQNRAKQAINQGRSPVIIDNTNTQAWEMKPYVEMAIGKGYRVEFHEPETWWKFDPEELEKRNKHGVSRKKIAQMLDRYEYHVSISIVMNSVEPTEKNSQRPLPLPGPQRERILKKSGHRFGKTKQKKNRYKKHNVLGEIIGANSFTPRNQEPSEREEEDFEEIKKESGCPITGGVQNETGDFMNGRKEKHWQNPDPADSLQNVLSVAELSHTAKNSLPQQEGDLCLTVSSVPNGSSAAHPMWTPHGSCVSRDDSACLEARKHMGNWHSLTLDAQDIVAGTPRSFMKTVDTVDESLPDEPVLCQRRGSRASENVSKEQSGYTIQNDCWDFFTTNLSGQELQLGSESHPYFGIWPEGPHKFVCEQRPKKDRSQKLRCPESTEQVIKLITTSEGASEPGSNPEVLTEESMLIENKDLSLSTATTDTPKDPEATVSRGCFSQLDIPKCTLESTKKKQKLHIRIFNWLSNCDLLGQTLIYAKEREKSGLFTENHRPDAVLGGKDSISEINNKEEEKQTLMTFDHHLFYLDIVKDFPPSIGQFYSHYLFFNRLGHAVYFYKNPVSSLVLHYISSFWVVSFNNRKTFLTFKSQRRVRNKLTDVGLISSEILSSLPNLLCSLRVTSDIQFLNESLGEKLKR